MLRPNLAIQTSIHARRGSEARTFALCCSLFAIFSGHVAARAADVGDPYAPLHRIDFGPDASIGDAAFSPDGKTLHVLVYDQALNLWSVLVYYWPEWLAVVTAGVVVWSIILLRRRRRRRGQIVGKPHCRQCNYCLEGCAGERCPECGRPIKTTVMGRRPWHGTVPVCCAAVGLVLASVVVRGISVPRQGTVSFWFFWPAPEWLTPEKGSIAGGMAAGHVYPTERIVEVDVPSGRIRREIFSQLHRSSQFGLSASPDGAWFFRPLARGDRLGMIDARSGRVAAAFDYPGLDMGMPAPAPSAGSRSYRSRWRQIAGFDERRRRLYVVVASRTGPHEILACDLHSRRAERVTPPPSAPKVASGRGYNLEYYYVPSSDPPRFIELLQVMGNSGWRDAQARLVGAAEPAETPVIVTTMLLPFSRPHFSEDGRTFMVETTEESEGLAAYDIESGALIRRVPLPRGFQASLRQTIDVQDRLFVLTRFSQGTFARFVAALARSIPGKRTEAAYLPPSPFQEEGRDAVLEYDRHGQRWTGRWLAPQRWSCGRVALSRDAHLLAVIGAPATQSWPPPTNQELLLYNFTALPEAVPFPSEP